MEKKKIIVYGMGKAYHEVIQFLENEFEIIGYSDAVRKNEKHDFIDSDQFDNYVYDYIYITSSRYFDEIKRGLCEKYGEQISERIISQYDVFGDFRNSEIRDNWIIEKLGQISKGKVLLDAGAGIMRYKPYCGHLQYIAQDFGEYDSFSNGTWDTSGVNIKCDIINMPLEDDSIDVVLCSEVFEHLKNPVLALKEFSRILKAGGELILTAPVCSLSHQVPYYFSNGFSKYWYKENLKEYDFEIDEILPNGNFFKYMSQELFRVKDMAEQYCNEILDEDEAGAILKCLKILSRLSAVDCGSDEMLCFGYMITAKKL